MLDFESLQVCYERISIIINRTPLWVLSPRDVKKLSFYAKLPERVTTLGILKFTNTHEEFEELFLLVNTNISHLISNDDLTCCNELLMFLFNDRYISKALAIMEMPSKFQIDPARQCRYILLMQCMMDPERANEFNYWNDIFDFTEDEIIGFKKNHINFYHRLIKIMYAYSSGYLGGVYCEGEVFINRYEELLSQLASLEKSAVFEFLFDEHMSITRNIGYWLENTKKIANGIITKRNDDTINERAFATELLKLFTDYGNCNFVSAVYKFTRSPFVINDIERKTIQRCWELVRKIKIKTT